MNNIHTAVSLQRKSMVQFFGRQIKTCVRSVSLEFQDPFQDLRILIFILDMDLPEQAVQYFRLL